MLLAANNPQVFKGQPQLPESLLKGFPDPAVIRNHKTQYSENLTTQLDQGSQHVKEQNEERKRELRAQAEQRKAQLGLEIDQQVRMQEKQLDEEATKAIWEMKMAALEQKAQLEQQAAALTLEYQTRKMHEEFMTAQADMARQYHESHMQIRNEATRRPGTPSREHSLSDSE